MSPWNLLCGIVAAAVLLVGCSVAPLSGVPVPESPTREEILSLEYSIAAPEVRRVLSEARRPFIVRVKDGVYRFPASALMSPFESIRVDAERAATGDVTGDGVPETVVPLIIGEGDVSVAELAVVQTGSGGAVHLVSFPLSYGRVESVGITNGKIRVRLRHMLPGDPAPRVSELTLQLP